VRAERAAYSPDTPMHPNDTTGPDAAAASGFRMVPLIERKKRGGEMSADELAYICREFVAGRLPDYQLAAWLMAVCWRGMTPAETLAFTRALVASGRTLDWAGLPGTTVDKHSTGGVGDKTSLVLVPLMAAAGLPFVKMSGRGLGHTGGTLDKLESIAGFTVEIPPERIRAQVERIGCALVGQSPELVPADGRFYALRDVTGTVDSVPLIASSIMSKKLAGGAAVVVLDVKYGSGAFLPAVEAARTLARTMVEIGEGAGRRTRAVLSPMEQPLGRAVGNAVEVREAIETLHGAGPADLWELTLALGAQQMLLAGAAASEAGARDALTRLRDSGGAAERFRQLIDAQGGDAAVVDDVDRLPRAALVRTVAHRPGEGAWCGGADARTIGDAALELGAGRRTKRDTIDLGAGVLVLARLGDRVEPGQPLAEIHAPDAARADAAEATLRRAFRFAPDPPAPREEGYEVVG
jgi:pyrimidine-nucleoside phosphorylase